MYIHVCTSIVIIADNYNVQSSSFSQLRLEQERKERVKHKEREKKQRRKMEGKPVTKKERETEALRQARLALLKEQGVWVGRGVIYHMF